MATDAQSLIGQAACYQCFTANPYAAELAKLALLKQILLTANPNAMTDPQSLLDQAKCYQCYAANPYMLQLMELALLVQITNIAITGGGGGGGGQIVIYTTTDPTADGQFPTNQNAPAFAYKADGTGTIFMWDPAGHLWH